MTIWATGQPAHADAGMPLVHREEGAGPASGQQAAAGSGSGGEESGAGREREEGEEGGEDGEEEGRGEGDGARPPDLGAPAATVFKCTVCVHKPVFRAAGVLAKHLRTTHGYGDVKARVDAGDFGEKIKVCGGCNLAFAGLKTHQTRGGCSRAGAAAAAQPSASAAAAGDLGESIRGFNDFPMTNFLTQRMPTINDVHKSRNTLAIVKRCLQGFSDQYKAAAIPETRGTVLVAFFAFLLSTFRSDPTERSDAGDYETKRERTSVTARIRDGINRWEAGKGADDFFRRRSALKTRATYASTENTGRGNESAG